MARRAMQLAEAIRDEVLRSRRAAGEDDDDGGGEDDPNLLTPPQKPLETMVAKGYLAALQREGERLPYAQMPADTPDHLTHTSRAETQV